MVRNVAIAMYEGEINMVIHAGGGEADVVIDPQHVEVTLTDHGPGIPDVSLAMKEGYSTAPDNVRNLGFGAGMGLPNMKNMPIRCILTRRWMWGQLFTWALTCRRGLIRRGKHENRSL